MSRFAVDVRVGERFDVDLVADVQPIGRRRLFARQAVGHVELIVDAEAIFGHMGQPGVADVFALGISLPGDRAGRFPAAPATIAVGPIDSANVARRGGTERLAQENIVSLLRGRRGDRADGVGMARPRRSGHAHRSDVSLILLIPKQPIELPNWPIEPPKQPAELPDWPIEIPQMVD